MSNSGSNNVYDSTYSGKSSKSYSGIYYNGLNPEEYKREESPNVNRFESVIHFYRAQASESVLSSTDSLPPKIKRKYTLLEELPSSTHFKEFKVRSSKDGMIYNLRVINLKSSMPKDTKENTAVTIFVKELIRFCMNQPSDIILEDIEEGNGFLAYVKRPGHCLKDECAKDNSALDVKKIVKDVLTDLDFLQNKMQLGSLSVKLANIFESERKTYYLDYWRVNSEGSTIISGESRLASDRIETADLSSSKLEAQIYQLGLAMIQLKSNDPEYIENLTKTSDHKTHNSAIKGVVSELDYSDKTKDLILKMVNKDPKNRAKLHDLIDDYKLVDIVIPQNQLSNSLNTYDLRIESSQYINHDEAFPKKIKGYPGTAHGVIVKAHKQGVPKISTGVLISPSIVLTSANNIFDLHTKSYYEKLEFIPGIDGNVEPPFGKIGVRKYYMPISYEEDQLEGTYGILILESPVGEKAGYLGLHIGDTLANLPKDPALKMVGYYQRQGMANNQEIQPEQLKMKGELIGVDPEVNWMSYRLKMVDERKGDGYREGMGGAGVYYEAENGACYLIGVHQSYDEDQEARIGYWIRTKAFEQIKSWAREAQIQDFQIEKSDGNSTITKAFGY